MEEEEQAFVDEIIADFDQITASKRLVRGKIGDLSGKFEILEVESFPELLIKRKSLRCN